LNVLDVDVGGGLGAEPDGGQAVGRVLRQRRRGADADEQDPVGRGEDVDGGVEGVGIDRGGDLRHRLLSAGRDPAHDLHRRLVGGHVLDQGVRGVGGIAAERDLEILKTLEAQPLAAPDHRGQGRARPLGDVGDGVVDQVGAEREHDLGDAAIALAEVGQPRLDGGGHRSRMRSGDGHAAQRRFGGLTGREGRNNIPHILEFDSSVGRRSANVPHRYGGRDDNELVVVLDCLDLDRSGAFWSAALGYVTAAPDVGAYRCLRPAGGDGIELLLQPVPEGKSGKNRVHLDLRTREMEAEVGLGARRATVDPIEEEGWRWHVLQDPDGNELCVLAPPESYWEALG
jgi:hypothetical protein